MPFAAAVTLAVGAYSANRQSQAGKDAARAQGDASAQQLAETARQYDQTREDQQPFLQAGYGALDRQEQYLSGDMSGFMNSAQYKGALEGGRQAIQRGNIGNLFGGGTTADLVRFGQTTANTFGNDYWNKLAGQAGQGQTAVNQLGALGQSYAGMNNNSYQNTANARGSAYANSANAWSNFGNQVGGMIGYGQGGGWYLGNNPGRG